MAELGWYNPELDSTPQSGIPTTDAPEWSDYAKQFGVGAMGLVSGARSGISYLEDKTGFTDAAQSAALGAASSRDTGNALQASMSQAGQQAATGSLLQHPLRGLAMRGIAMSPALAAAALPGGLIADALGGALGGMSGAIGAGAINAALSGGQFADQIAGRIDDTPDQELRKQSPTFDEMRNSMGEQDARDNYRDYLADGQGRMALVLLGGAVGGGFGIGGQIAKGATGRMLGSAAEAGLAGGAQAGASDLGYQSAMMHGGFQSHADVGEWAQQVFENMGIGAIAGGLHGYFGHQAPKKAPVERVEGVAPSVEQSAALDTTINTPKAPSQTSTSEPQGAPQAANSDGGSIPTAEPEKPVQPPSPPPSEPPTAPPATLPADPTQESNPATEATQPEAPNTLQAQYGELQKAQRPAMVFKQGEQVPKGISGFGLRKLVVPAEGGPDTWVYNPQLVKQGDLRKSITDNTAGEKYLGLGPVTKDEAVQSIQGGATPVAVTERTPEGVEVKAAAGSSETLPQQVPALQQGAAPENSVQVENPARVIAERQQAQVPATSEPFVATKPPKKVRPPKAQAALKTSQESAPKPITPEMRVAAEEAAARINASLPGKRVLADVSPEGQATREATDAAQAKNLSKLSLDDANGEDAPEVTSTGRHTTELEKTQRKSDNSEAKKIVEAHPPTDLEDLGGPGKMPKPGAFNVVRERAKAMVKAAKEAGITIPHRVGEAADKEYEISAHLMLLADARDLLKPKYKKDASGRVPSPEMRAAEFVVRDRAARDNNRDAMTELRRAQTDKGGLGSPEGVGENIFVARDEAHDLSGRDSEVHAKPDETMSEHNRDEQDIQHASEEENVADKNNGGQSDVQAREDQIFEDVRALVRPDGKALSGDVEVGEGGRPAPFEKVVDIARRAIEDGTVRPVWVQVQRVLDLKPFDAMKVLNRALEQIRDEKPTTSESSADPQTAGYQSRAGKFEVAKKRTIKVSNKVAKLEVGSDWTVPVTGHDTSLSVTSSGKMRDILTDMHPRSGRAGSELEPVLARKLMSIVGDMDVHIVPDAELTRMLPNVAGFFDPVHNHIVLSDALSGQDETHTVLHEALHGALFHKINADPVARKQLFELMFAFQIRNPKFNSTNTHAMINVHEFLNETLTNPKIREAALGTPISPDLAGRLGIFGKAANLWNGLLAFTRRALGVGPEYTSVLDGVMSVAGRLGLDKEHAGRDVLPNDKIAALQPITREALRQGDPEQEARDPRGFTSAREKLLSTVSDQIASQKSWGSELWNAKAFKFLSGDQLRQSKEHLFGAKDESNPVRRLVDSTEKAGVYMKELLKQSGPIIDDMWRASKEHEGPEWDKFAKLINDTTIYNVHPDALLESDANAHLRVPEGASEEEGAMASFQSRAKHAELAKEFASLPKDLQSLYQRARDFYANERNERVKQHVKAIIEGHDAPQGVAKKRVLQRILNGTMTEADQEHYDQFGIGKALKTSRDMQRTTGPYFPLKRRGDYVVTGEHEIKAPLNAKPVQDHPNQFDFDTREEAHAFAIKQNLPTKVAKAYFDPATGEKTTKLGGISTEGVAAEKYRATVQHQHVEYHQTESDAHQAMQSMQKAGLKNVTMPDMKRKNANVEYGMRSATLNHLIKAVERRDDLSNEQKATLVRSLEQSSVALQRGNRFESHYLERKNVAGASTDVVKNLTDYAQASAAFRSRAEFKDGIDGALKDMRDLKDSDRMNPDTAERSRVIQEYEQRIEGFGSPEYMGKVGPVWQRMMMLSFLKRMASPAHLALHMMHPVMTSIPVLSGEHGLLRTQREFLRAYRDMGGGGALGEGVKGLVRVARENSGPTNFGDYFRKQLKNVSDRDALGAMMKELEATGHLHPDSGFDVARYDSSKGSIDHGFERVDRAFRELTSATESMNRYATAITAYRLAIKKSGATPETAIRYAKDTVANTQGLYSATNSAPIFKGAGWKKAVMQFKQYPAMVIHLMGKLVHDAFRGDTPEVRQAALRSFATMMGTAAVLTGVNGLPTEGAKAVTLLGNALGVTPSWDEVTNNMRMGLAHNLGPTLSNLVMNGISSLGPTAVDAHHRLGFSSMLVFGEPRSDKPDDVMNWLYGVIGGAPGSLLKDTLEGAQALRHGNLELAFEKLTPVKALDDLGKAARMAVEGKPTPSGKPGMSALTAPEALMQGLGFTPRRVADYGEAKHNADRDIHALPKKPQHGPKGNQILGIAQSKRSNNILNNYSKSYGVE